MVIHDESGLIAIPPVIKKPLFEPQSISISENQNQKSKNTNESDFHTSEPTKKLRKKSENESDQKVRISSKKSKKTDHFSSYPSENSDSSTSTSKISAEDIEELRTVYKKCKLVIRKIETKYGHLLDLNEQEPLKRRRKNTKNTTDDELTECHCTMNKKIVFDDDGKEIAIDTAAVDHICPKKSRYSQAQITQPSNDLQIEYFNQLIELPDCLQELKTILQNPGIEINYRNQVIQKVKAIRQEFSYDMKFNKHSIIEKIKANVDEMIEFKGSNLSSLSGYVY